MTLRVIAIAAMDEARVIGAKNALPWSIPEDSRRFFSLTKGHAVLMGRKTYESLPARFRPLPQRRNLVISRSPAQLAQDSGIEVHTCACELIDSARSGAYALPS
ncbi:MAG TPA: dihydrofolate reductase, partial [Oligoflexia bacterium]|nr:dihydrofolate reductase [Oligoflexia bacterium]